MFRRTDRHLERDPQTMVSSAPGLVIGCELAVLVVPVWTRLLIAPPPTTNAYHLVICLPAVKGIIGCMHSNEASAVPHVFFEGCLQVGRPPILRSIVVEDDDLISAPVGFEI